MTKKAMQRTRRTLAASRVLFPCQLASRCALTELDALYALEGAVRLGLASRTNEGAFEASFKLLYEEKKLGGVPEDSPTAF